jgi:autotransporter-associated beta strand protein
MHTRFFLPRFRRGIILRALFRVRSSCVLLVCFLLLQAVKLNAQFTFNESFTGSSAPGWEFVQDGSGVSPGPRLTADAIPVSADPEYGNGAIDSSGDGWLRLTTTTGNQSNAVALDTPIPSQANNISISFDFTMWSGNAADGMTVFLWDASVPFDPGAFGGSLGYADRTGSNGLAGAYVGVGLDVYGNFSNDQEGRSGAYPSGADISNALNPNQVVLRGPDDSVNKDGTGNYYYMAGTGGKNYTVSGAPNITGLNATTQNLAYNSSTVRPDQDADEYRSFNLTLNSSNQLTVSVQFGYSSAPTTLFTADLSSLARPDQLRIGFSGATGGNYEVAELRNLSIAASASADSFYWDNEGGNTLWDTGSNWDQNTVPANYSTVLFTDDFPLTQTPQSVVINGGNRTHKSIVFSGDTSYSITPQTTQTITLELDADASDANDKVYISLLNSLNGNADHSISANLNLGDQTFVQNLVNQTLTLSGNVDTNGNTLNLVSYGTTALSGVVSDAGAIVKTETGKAILSGNNTYSGLTTVNAGILEIANNNALGATAADTVVNSGGTLALANNITTSTAESVLIAGAGAGGQGALSNTSGSNTWRGEIDLTADATIGALSGTLTLDSSNTLDGVGHTITFNPAAGANIVVNRNVGDTTGVSPVIKDGLGTTTFSVNNTYDGATTVNAGVLRIQNANGLGNTTAGTTVNAGATLEFAGSILLNSGEAITASGSGVSGKAALWSDSGVNEINGSVALANGGASMGAASGQTLRMDGVVSGSEQYATITGFGTVEYRNAMTYTGATNIDSGTLSTTVANAISDSSAVTVSSGASYVLNNNSDTIGSLAGAGNVNLGSATLTAGGDNTSTAFGGVMSGTGIFTKAGTGTMTLTGASTYTGLTNVNAGVLSLGASEVISNSSTLAMNGGTLQLNGYAETVGAFDLNASSTVDFTSTTGSFLTAASVATAPVGTLSMANWSGNAGTTSALSTTTRMVVNSGSITADMTTLASNTDFLGWGTGSDWKSVSGGYELVPTLSGVYRWDRASGVWGTGTDGNQINWNNNTAPPGTTAGTLVYFGNDEDPAGGTQNTAAAHTVTMSGNRTVGTMILDGTDGRDYSFTASGGNRTLTFNQTGTATAYLTVSGTQSHVIGSSNTNNQRVNVALSDNLLIQNNSTATTGLTFGTAGGSHTFDTNGYTVTIDGSSQTIIHSQITDAGSLLKNGTGTLTLNDNSNSYSGSTTLNAGTLQLGANGALGSGIFIINGGAIEATGGDRTINDISSYAIASDFSVIGSNDLRFDESGTVSGVRTATVAADIDFTLNGSLTGTGGLVKEGDGTLLFLGAGKSFSGGLTVNDGTVLVTAPSGTDLILTGTGGNMSGTGAITVNTGAIYTASTSGSDDRLQIGAGGQFTNAGGTVTFTGIGTGEDGDFQQYGSFNQTSGNTTVTVGDDVIYRGGSLTHITGGNYTVYAPADFAIGGQGDSTATVYADFRVTNGADVLVDQSAATGTGNSAQLGRYDRLTVDGVGSTFTITPDATAAVNLDGYLNLHNGGVMTVEQGDYVRLDSTTRFDGGTGATKGTLVVKTDLVVDNPVVTNEPNLTMDVATATSIAAETGTRNLNGLGIFTKTGSGTTTIEASIINLQAKHIVITGGTLLLGASNQMANTNAMTLGGGTFATGGNSEVLSTLTLTATSTIDMGASSSLLTYSDGGTRTSGSLNIENWSGTPGYGNGTDQLIFGTVLSSDFLNSVIWKNINGQDIYGAIQLANGEIVPIPEASTLITASALILLAIGYDYRRRRSES